jgi:MFS transporter, DHA1 family, multidrug resistance protein
MSGTGSSTTVSRSLFVAATLLYWVALYLYVPTLPAFAATRTQNLAAVGTLLSMYGLWQAIARIPVGIAVDAVGRGKLFIIGGFAFAIAGALFMGLGGTIGLMTLGRSFTGLAAATWVPLIAVFSGLYPPKQAVVATSLITFSASVGRMLATSITGFLNNIGGYPLAYMLAAGAGGLAAVIIAVTPLEEQARTGVSPKAVGRLFARTDVILPSLISLVAQIGNWSVTFGFLPILAENLGGGDVAKSLLVSLNLLMLTVANLLNTVVAKRVRREHLLFVTVFIFCGSILVLASAPSLAILFVGTALMGFSNGFTYPTLMGMSIERVEQPQRSTAMGIHQSVYAIGMFIGPWIGGLVAEAQGIRPMFRLVAFLIFGANYLLLFVYRYFIRREAAHERPSSP